MIPLIFTIPSLAQTPPAVSGWVPAPLLSAEQKSAGIFPGGEGGQWPRDLAISSADPNFLILAIDVGGLYRSLDGGKSWRQSLAGWNARGCNAIAIDPKNANHVLGVGGNSGDFGDTWLGGKSPNGVYVSSDRAKSWTQTLSVFDGHGGRVAFDPTSFDSAKNACRRAFFLSVKQGLFASGDSGATWKFAGKPLKSEDPESYLRVAENGAVFVGGKDGLFLSTNHGATFTRLRETAVGGLDISPDGSVFVSDATGVHRSTDSGKTFVKLAGANLDLSGKLAQNIRVSPADPKRLAVWVRGDNWKWVRYVSHDAGATFQPISIEKRLSVLPNNARDGFFAWHPKDPNVIFGIGGDIVTRSTDGGRNFVWSANGYNGIMLGGQLNVSLTAPNAIFLAFQDYNAALSTDGGKLWRYLDASGKGWGGFCYGGHTADGVTLFYGDAESWGGPRRLRVSRDAGKTWAFPKDKSGKELVFSGRDVSHSAPGNPKILFASQLRSSDGGANWQSMNGCDGVFVALKTGELVGLKGKNSIVKSTDSGAMWAKIADAPGELRDVAFDPTTNCYFAAAGDKLLRLDGKTGAWTTIETPRDQYGNRHVKTVAIDPKNPARIFVGGSADIYATQSAVCGSTDGGASWTNLTAGDGPFEVNAMRVHPTTGDLWVNGQCYGMWRFPLAAKFPIQPAAKPAPIAPSARSLAAAISIVPPKPTLGLVR